MPSILPQASCRIPLWAQLTWVQIFCLLVVISSMFGIMYSSDQVQLSEHYREISDVIQVGIWSVANELVLDLHQDAMAVWYAEPLLQQCLMPSLNYIPNGLVRLFNGLNSQRHPLSSLGIIQYAPNTSKGKISWQIAAGYGCPTYMYAAAEPISWPNFYGWCVDGITGAMAAGPPAYTGMDWGLKSHEMALLMPGIRSVNETFLPVFSLLGSFTLTYEKAIFCNNSAQPYAAVFAEQRLSNLDVALTELTRNNSGVSVIVERTTGFLIASSIPNQTQVINGTDILRVTPCNASDPILREICQSIGGLSTITTLTDPLGKEWTSGPSWVTAMPYSHGLDWVLLVSIPQTSFVTLITNASNLLIGIAVLLAVLSVVFVVSYIYFFVTRRLNLYNQAARESDAQVRNTLLNTPSHLTEVDDMRNLVALIHETKDVKV